jgi:hypothetical protein
MQDDAVPKQPHASQARKIDRDKIKYWISEVLYRSIRDADLTRLIQASVSMAQSMLSVLYWKQLTHFAYAGYTPSSAACRCIEELFYPRAGIACYELFIYFSTNQLPFEQAHADDVLIALRQLIKSKLTQRFSEIYAEMDPVYKKISRNVHEALARSDQYVQTSHVKGVYVARADEDLLLHLQCYPLDELLTRFSNAANREDSIPVLIGKLFDVLNRESNFRRTITVDEIILMLRDYFYLIQKAGYQSEQISASEEDLDTSGLKNKLGSIVDTAVLRVQQTILKKLVAKKKCSQLETEKIVKAMKMFLHDIIAQDCRTFFHYFSGQFPEVPHEEYREKNRKTFEYIMAKAREVFYALARKHFGSGRTSGVM